MVGRVRLPHGRDEDAATQSRLGRAGDLGDGVVDIVQDRHQRDAGAAGWAIGTELGEPAVVGSRAGHEQLRVVVTTLAEAGAERC